MSCRYQRTPATTITVASTEVHNREVQVATIAFPGQVKLSILHQNIVNYWDTIFVAIQALVMQVHGVLFMIKVN